MSQKGQEETFPDPTLGVIVALHVTCYMPLILRGMGHRLA
jgi:hypothetical protein